jgi:hypothetical protein
MSNDKNQIGIYTTGWQGVIVLVVALVCVGWVLSSAAGCEARSKEAFYKAKVENSKDRLNYEKFLLENGHIEEPKLKY